MNEAFRLPRSSSCSSARGRRRCSASRVVATQDRVDRALPHLHRGARRRRERVRRAGRRPTPLVYGSIDGMLRTLDPHSSFLDPTRLTRRCASGRSGRYFGIGISIVLGRRRHHRDVALRGIAGVSRRHPPRRRHRARRQTEDAPRAGATDRTSSSACKGPKGTTVEISIRRPGRRHADRPDRRARRDQDHDRAHGVHDRAGHRLRPPAGLLRDDRRRSSARR